MKKDKRKPVKLGLAVSNVEAMTFAEMLVVKRRLSHVVWYVETFANPIKLSSEKLLLLHISIEESLKLLNKTDMIIVLCRFGIGMTVQQVAKILNCSSRKVSYITPVALRRLSNLEWMK